MYDSATSCELEIKLAEGFERVPLTVPGRGQVTFWLTKRSYAQNSPHGEVSAMHHCAVPVRRVVLHHDTLVHVMMRTGGSLPSEVGSS